MSTITTENLIVTNLTVETINGQPVSYFYSGTCDNSCSDDNCNGCDNCDDNGDCNKCYQPNPYPQCVTEAQCATGDT